jgi:hypothetical protein
MKFGSLIRFLSPPAAFLDTELGDGVVHISAQCRLWAKPWVYASFLEQSSQ